MATKGQLFTAQDRMRVDDSQDVPCYAKTFILYGKSQAKLSLFQVSFVSVFLSRSHVYGSGLHVFYHILQFTVSVRMEASVS